MRNPILFVTIGLLVAGCGNKTPNTVGHDSDVSERSKTEYRIFYQFASDGTHECWVPRSELPKVSLWTNLSIAPPVSVEEAIGLAAKTGGDSPDQLVNVMLIKEMLPDVPVFWKYTLTFGRTNGYHCYVVLMDGRVFTANEIHAKR
jgi:hypothetical protein